MTTLDNCRRQSRYALTHWGGRMAIVCRPVDVGEQWLVLSSHCPDYGAFVTDCSAGDVVTGDGYAGEVVEVWELTGKV
jgi:hypothetical protein